MSEALSEEKGGGEYKRVQLGPRRIEIPESWEKTQLGELGNYLNGYGFKSSEWSDEGRPIIRIQNLTDSAGGETNYYGGSMKDRYVVHEGDLLVSWSATLGVFIWDGPEALLNQHIFKVEPSKKVEDSFLYFLLDHNLDLLEMRVQGSTMKHIRKSTFEDTFVPLPPFNEQRRIAAILSTIDEQIQQTDKIIKASGDVLTGLKQDLLFGRKDEEMKKIKMGPKSVEIPSNWEVTNLGDIGRENEKSFIDGDWVESEDMIKDGPYQLIQLGNIGTGEFKGECDKYVSDDFFTDENCTLVEEGDLLISRLADPVLRTIEVPSFDKKSITAVDIVVAKVDEKKFDKRYLRFLLNSKVMGDVGEALASGSTRLRISRKNMEKITIPYPPKEYQTDVGDVLETVENRIHREKSYRQTLQELKQALMQDLLTGKVRVNDITIEDS